MRRGRCILPLKLPYKQPQASWSCRLLRSSIVRYLLLSYTIGVDLWDGSHREACRRRWRRGGGRMRDADVGETSTRAVTSSKMHVFTGSWWRPRETTVSFMLLVHDHGARLAHLPHSPRPS